MSATYVSQASCPKKCPFHCSGCYAETGHVGIITNRLSKSRIKNHVKIAQCEADGIRQLTGQYPLRLHVVGDSSTPKAAEIVSSAAEEYMAKFSQPVFTYTHARIPREHWGSVSVLRSCTTVRQTQVAYLAGYASALVVSEFESDKRYSLKQGRGMYGIPCPKQTGRMDSCNSCKLCFMDTKLHKSKNVILFKAHGVSKRIVAEMVEL